MGLRDDLSLVARGWRWTRRSLVPRSAEPWATPREPKAFPTRWARTPPARVAREAIQRVGLKPLVWHETKPEVFGREHLDGVQGPVVFVANHSSHLDAPLILCSLPREWADRVAVGAAADYFFDARWRAAVTALAFNAFPIERHGGRRVSSLPRELLTAGWSLLLFPEGTRSADGWMHRFRHGVGRLCVDAGAPAVPIALRGAYAAMPRGRSWPRPGRPRIGVRFGAPLHPGEDEHPREFTARMRHSLSRLWQEDATTWWESLQQVSQDRLAEPTGPQAPRWRRVWDATAPQGGGAWRRRAWR